MKVEFTGHFKNHARTSLKAKRTNLHAGNAAFEGGCSSLNWIGSNHASILVVKHAGRSRAADGANASRRSAQRNLIKIIMLRVLVRFSLARVYISVRRHIYATRNGTRCVKNEYNFQNSISMFPWFFILSYPFIL